MTMLTDDREMDPAAEGAQARLSTAWHWLCEQRGGAPDTADVWDIRWQHLNTGEGWLTALEGRLLRGTYRLSPLQLHGQGAQRRAVWGAQDALVLKWVALSLQHLLPLHPSCEHVKGHGGGKSFIEKLHGLLTDNTDAREKKTDDSISPAGTPHYRWVCRTDIRGYYRNIRKETLMQQVRQHVISPVLRDLVHQYLHYTVEDGGTFHTPEKGISRGCPLSPLMGALHLYDMDVHFSRQQGIHYARYMDDVIILVKSRWSLRKQTKQLMQWFSEYGFEAHPDKTFIGRTEKGFDWMGAWLTHEGVTDIAPRAKANHREKVRRLYERLARVPFWKRKRAQKQVHARVSAYRLRWNIWAACVVGAALAAPSPSATAAPLYVYGNTPAYSTVWTRTTAPGSGTAAVPSPDSLQATLQDLSMYFAPLGEAITAAYAKTELIPGSNGQYGIPLGGSASRFWLTWDTVGGASFAYPWYTATRTYRGTLPDQGGTDSGSFTASGSISTSTNADRFNMSSLKSTGPSAYFANDPIAGPYKGADAIAITGSLSSWAASTNVNGAWKFPSVRYSIIYVPSGTVTSYTIPANWRNLAPSLLTSPDHGKISQLVAPVILPDSLIVTGVSCSITNSAFAPVTVSDINLGGAADTLQASGVLPAVQVTCTGGVDPTDPQINVGLTYVPAAGTELVSGRNDAVSASDDPGSYLTLNSGPPSCQANSTSIDLTGASPQHLGTIQPGTGGPSYTPAALNYALCAAGGAGKVGAHTIRLTVSSTMY